MKNRFIRCGSSSLSCKAFRPNCVKSCEEASPSFWVAPGFSLPGGILVHWGPVSQYLAA